MPKYHLLLLLIGVSTLLTGCAVSSGGKVMIAIIACIVSVIIAVVGQLRCFREDRVCKKAAVLDKSLKEHVDKYHGTEG